MSVLTPTARFEEQLFALLPFGGRVSRWFHFVL